MFVAHELALAVIVLAACTPHAAEDEPAKVEPRQTSVIGGTPLPVVHVAAYEMAGSAVYTASPDAIALAGTEAARRGTPIVGIVPFCIGVSGRPSYVATPWTGDGHVDAILRMAVLKSRYKPYRVDGVARRACSATKFDIVFE